MKNAVYYLTARNLFDIIIIIITIKIESTAKEEFP